MNTEASFNTYFSAHVKRVLTQMDRDPDSPTYGCFDRNYWHYKIRDFPSSILQQGVFVLEQLRQKPSEILTEQTASEWTLAAINALSRQVGRNGAVSEYFPYEDSYPASAFGLYCAAKVIHGWKEGGVSHIERVDWPGLRALAKRLAGREECEAANQYAAGVAALAMASAIPELKVRREIVKKHADKLFSLQDPEGWFHEYEGPDFGYLTVTIDALVDYFDATQDTRTLTAIDKAVGFIAELVGCDDQLPWTLNARNTDYVVPYGLVRTAKRSPVASWLVHKLFACLGDTEHAIWSTDDRYHLHYIYSSIVRSLPYLAELIPPKPPEQKRDVWLQNCGYLVRRVNGPDATIYVGAYKGGVVRVHKTDEPGISFDNGWRLKDEHELSTTNWWQPNNTVTVSADCIVVTGHFVRSKHVVPTPRTHVILRMLAFLSGRQLTTFLKKMMIFRKSSERDSSFSRAVCIDVEQRKLSIEDKFSIVENAKLHKSPRQNLRHVASADSFSLEENLGMHEYLVSRRDYDSSRLSRKISI